MHKKGGFDCLCPNWQDCCLSIRVARRSDAAIRFDRQANAVGQAFGSFQGVNADVAESADNRTLLRFQLNPRNKISISLRRLQLGLAFEIIQGVGDHRWGAVK